MVEDEAGRIPYVLFKLGDLLVLLLIGRTDPLSLTPIGPIPKIVLAKAYNWTYTTTFESHGHFDPDSTSNILSHSSWKPADPDNPSNAIPFAELPSRSNPVLCQGSSFRR